MIPQIIGDCKLGKRYKQNSGCVFWAESIKWHQRRFAHYDTHEICSWVQNRQLLQLVSGDDGDRLTPSILMKWLNYSIDSIVVVDTTNDQLAGFCTISSSEITCPPFNFIELCHLIVNPQYRYLFIGPRLCKAAKAKARIYGFPQLYGRVVHQHRFGLALARYEEFSELSLVPEWLPYEFRWFRHTLIH